MSSNYLVVGPSWVGDMVMAQSLFIELKRRHPECRIDVLAPGWTFPLLNRMPQVCKGVVMPLGHGQLGFMERLALGRSLRSTHYDRAIVLPHSWKSALVPFFAGIPIRSGYIGELRWGLLNDARGLDKKRLPMTVQRFVELGFRETSLATPNFAMPKLIVTSQGQASVIAKFTPTRLSNGVIGLCPGAEYGPAKRWPAEHFASIALTKIEQGWSVWLFGSVKDRSVADEILSIVPECEDFTGRTDLSEAIDLMSLTDVVVTNDSGLMHVAAALNKKVLAIYGSSDPAATPPLNPQAKIISMALKCSPCLERTCIYGHYLCLRDITPERILTELNRL